MQAHEQAHRFALQAQSHVEIARALSGLGDAYYQRGSMVTAREHFAQCIKEARDHGLVGVLLSNLPMLGDHAHVLRRRRPRAARVAARGSSSRGASATCAASCSCTSTMASGLLMQAQLDECRSRARQAMQLAKQLGARRFEAECMGIVAATMHARTIRPRRCSWPKEALQLGRETGMSYCGPMLLSMVARLTPNGPRARRARWRKANSCSPPAA